MNTYDNEMLCTDCAMYVVNNDDSGNFADWDKQTLIDNLAKFNYYAANAVEDFSTQHCGGCETTLAGTRHEFHIEDK